MLGARLLPTDKAQTTWEHNDNTPVFIVWHRRSTQNIHTGQINREAKFEQKNTHLLVSQH